MYFQCNPFSRKMCNDSMNIMDSLPSDMLIFVDGSIFQYRQVPSVSKLLLSFEFVTKTLSFYFQPNWNTNYSRLFFYQCFGLFYHLFRSPSLFRSYSLAPSFPPSLSLSLSLSFSISLFLHLSLSLFRSLFLSISFSLSTSLSSSLSFFFSLFFLYFILTHSLSFSANLFSQSLFSVSQLLRHKYFQFPLFWEPKATLNQLHFYPKSSFEIWPWHLQLLLLLLILLLSSEASGRLQHPKSVTVWNPTVA